MELSDELIAYVASFLDAEARVSFARTSKAVHRVVASEEMFQWMLLTHFNVAVQVRRPFSPFCSVRTALSGAHLVPGTRTRGRTCHTAATTPTVR